MYTCQLFSKLGPGCRACLCQANPVSLGHTPTASLRMTAERGTGVSKDVHRAFVLQEGGPALWSWEESHMHILHSARVWSVWNGNVNKQRMPKFRSFSAQAPELPLPYGFHFLPQKSCKGVFADRQGTLRALAGDGGNSQEGSNLR